MLKHDHQQERYIALLKKMKQQLIENIKKAGERGELTAHQVYDISHDSVVQAAQKLKGEAEELREFMKEAVTTTVQTLVDAEEASEKNISAALHGAVDGIKQVESRTLHAAHEELGQVKKHLKEEEGKFAGIVNEVFLGTKEAAEDFSGEVKVNIETALADAKLKSVELLGLTRDTVKDAVHKAIDTETKLEETVVGITRDATAKALGEVRLTGKRARKVSESVLSAAVEAAEELGSDVKETASAAAEGVRLGLTDSIEFTRKSITNVSQSVKEFSAEDLAQTKEDLDAVGDLFVETLRKVADSSGEAARDILDELADDAKKAGSSLRENAGSASHTVAERIKELSSEVVHKTGEVSSKAAHTLAEETKELSERMLAVAKGAATGMWEGAKEALKNDENEEDKP
jgi:hypothetical protein